MSDEILAVAIFEPLPGKENDALQSLRALLKVLAAKGYSRDQLYHDPRKHRYFALRYWTSAEARSKAQEDPEIQSYWAKLGNEIKMIDVYEKLDEVART